MSQELETLVANDEQGRALNEEGRRLYIDGKYDQSLDRYQRTLNLKPPVADELRIAALIGAGAALRRLRKFDDAAEMFRQAGEALDGARSGALLREQGWLCFYQQSYPEAWDHFKEAEGLLTGDDQHWARVGLLASQQQLDLSSANEQKNARQLVEDWLKAGVEKPEVIRILVDCSASVLEELNLYPAALENARHLLDVDNDNADGVYLKIGALKWLRRYAEAEKAFLDAPHDVQTNAKVWKERANVYYERKQFKEAHAYYSGQVLNGRQLTPEEAALKKLLRENTEAREWTSVSLRKMRKSGEARAEMTEALSSIGAKPNFYGELACVYYADRDYDNAIKMFDRALALDDYETFSLQWRIACLRKKGKEKYPEVEQALSDALKKAPYAPRLWEEAGWLAFDKEDFEAAITAFDKASELDPYVITRQLAKVEALVRLNRSDDALRVFEDLEKQFPNDAEIGEQRCWFHIRFGQLDAAREQQLRLRQAHPNSVLGLNAEGGYELAQRNNEKAVKAFRGAIDQVDYEPQYHVNLALALLRQVRSPGELSKLDGPTKDELIDKAKEHCRKALKLDQYHAKAYGCLGTIAFTEQEYVDAEFYFRKSIALNPSEGSQVELASLYCQMGRYEEATEKLNEALKLNRRDARAYIELANVAVLEGKAAEAVRYCREAVYVQPRNPETHRALAIALMRAEQNEEAERVVRRALRNLKLAKPWRLRLLLAEILVRLGDADNKDRKKKDLDLYEQALNSVNEAKDESMPNADLYFHAGIVQHRLEDFATSQKNFADCVKLDPERFEAERYSRIVQTALDQQRRTFNVNERFSYGLAALCFFGLVVLWGTYFGGAKRTITVDQPATNTAPAARVTEEEFVVDGPLLNFMTPLLLGLFTISALLPTLSKLKLPGFEAEISDPKSPEPTISSGPRGDIKFGSSMPIVDAEPR